MRIYHSRHSTDVTGADVKWEAGERAIFTGEDGVAKNVTLENGEPVRNAATPELCYEVRFDDEAGRPLFCVEAKRLMWTTGESWAQWVAAGGAAS